MNFQPVAIGIEPRPYVAVFMVGRVVLNEHRSLPAIAASQLFQESEVRGSVEDGLLPVMEASLPEFNGPQIFTLLRCPVTGTSGGQPIRLQVACRVESWRKLASSVKSNAQFCRGAFF